MNADIRIVLVNTSHPGNIGAVARAMKNMCLENLVLVDPVHYPHAQATARASGADDVLQQAAVVETLEQAVAGCDLVIGASARMRRLSWPQLDPRQVASRIANEPPGSRVAILFGREHSGLTNEELERCHFLLCIPSNPGYSSLNIAAAVQIIAYEIYVACTAESDPEPDVKQAAQTLSLDGEPYAGADDMERFFEHLYSTLVEIGFLQTQHPRKMMRRLRRLFNRTRPDRVELNILRGILSTAQRAAKDSRERESPERPERTVESLPEKSETNST